MAAATRPSSATAVLGASQRPMPAATVPAATSAGSSATARSPAPGYPASGAGRAATSARQAPVYAGKVGSQHVASPQRSIDVSMHGTRSLSREVTSLAASYRMASRTKQLVANQQGESSRHASKGDGVPRPAEDVAEAATTEAPAPAPTLQAAPLPGSATSSSTMKAPAPAERPRPQEASDALSLTKQPSGPMAAPVREPQHTADRPATQVPGQRSGPRPVSRPSRVVECPPAGASQAEQPPAEAPQQSSRTVEQPELPRRADEELRRRIQLFEKGSKPSTASSGPKQKGATAAGQAASPSLANVSTTANSAAVSTAGTRTSSPAPRSPTESGETSHHLGFKERQVVELRAQIARCERHLYGGGHPATGTAVASEPSQSEPERTGPRSPGASSLGNSSTGLKSGPAPAPLEEELAWIVRQMEVHRNQIQIHQQQLSSLEKRHAEIVAAISATHCRSPASSMAEVRPDISSLLGGASSPRVGIGMRQLESRLDSPASSATASQVWPNSPEQPAVPQPRSLAGSVRSFSSGLGGLHGNSHQEDTGSDSSYAQALAAAEARLGLRSRSRPTSAGSNRSPYFSRAARPASACSTISDRGGRDSLTATLNGQDEEHQVDGLYSAASSTRGGRPPPSTREGLLSPSDLAGHLIRGEGGLRPDAGQTPLAGEGTPLDETQESHLVATLLEQLTLQQPMRVPFVPLDGSSEGRGRPYLHGSLEVRLLLSDDATRLLVRVGTGGRPMDIEDFIARKEAIELRRAYRPNPIAEEDSPAGGATPCQQPSPAAAPSRPMDMPAEAAKPTSTLRSLLSQSEDLQTSARSLPWKNLFKAHWDSR